jgi:hypothetical protein
MTNFLSFFENAHSNIDSLIEGNQIKNRLKEITGLKDSYRFGKEKRGMFSQNILDSIVDVKNPLSGERGNNIEDMLKGSLSMELGKNRNWLAELFGSKGNVGFNLSRRF